MKKGGRDLLWGPVGVMGAMVLLGVGARAHAQVATSGEAPPPPEAAPNGSVLGEIVVTAQRRAERLQDVPIAITAITASNLSAAGIATTGDLNLVVPGLNYTSVAGYVLPRIRGVGSTTSVGGNENEVATYIDGVYVASSTSSMLSFNNVEEVSVLKGPQGTLFGRNATGGVIQVTTRDPKQTFGGQASVTAANLETFGGDFYVTGGLTSALSADLALHFNSQSEGFGRNLYNGRQINNVPVDLGLRSKFKLELDDKTTIRVALDYEQLKANIPAYRPVFGSLSSTGAEYTGGTFDINSNTQPVSENKQNGESITLNRDLGGASLVSITAHRESKYDFTVDSDKTPSFLAATGVIEKDHQFSEEMHLLSAPHAPLQWLLGIYYFHAGTSFTTAAANPATTAVLYTDQVADSVAGFAQATYRITPKLGLTAGFRYTYEERNFTGSGEITHSTPTSGAAPLSSGGPIAPIAPVAGETVIEKPTWRLNLDYHFDKNILGYISYNRGFKSGGFNPTRVALPLDPYQGEQLDAYEIGLKSDLLNGRLRVNAAGYYYQYDNIQVTSYNNGVATIYNATSADIYGLDADIAAVPIEHLTLTGGLSLIHDRFGPFANAVVTTPLPQGGLLLAPGNATGNRLPLTPDWTLSAGADYVATLERGRLDLSLNYLHNSGWYGEVDNRLHQKPYDLVNASATWWLDDASRYSVQLWAKNLADTVYAVTLVSSAQASAIALAPGRTFGITLGAKF